MPYPSAEHVEVVNQECPHCKEPLLVSGRAGTRNQTRDSIEEIAFCRNCDKNVGLLRVVFSTIFGIEEDERVLRGRARVY